MGCGEGSTALMTEFLRQAGGTAIIDGGLATELERHGADLNDPLWSAKCLLTSPHLIRRVHLDYLEAGADVIITASYQATIQGFEAKGFTREESEGMLRKSVEIAIEARDVYRERCQKDSACETGNGRILNNRLILVAASVGSYGAYLADGSEYSGNYGDAVTLNTLKEFHRRRVQVLAEAGADLIAFETIPNKVEAQAFVELLEEENINIPAWFSFNSKDGINVVSGDSFVECASVAESCKKVVAVGINCTPPRFIHGLISSIAKVVTKPILIYPNSGESYDPDLKEWVVSRMTILPRMLTNGATLGLPSSEVVVEPLQKRLDRYIPLSPLPGNRTFPSVDVLDAMRLTLLFLVQKTLRGLVAFGAHLKSQPEKKKK